MNTVMKPIFALSIIVLLLGGFAAAPAPAEYAGAGLKIDRIYLGFEDRQPRRTVARRQEGLRAFADIDYTGSGLFEACWLVDGKFFADVAQHLTGTGTIRLASPATPGLPTIAEGLHIVALVVKTPVQSFASTRISYFVFTDVKSSPPLITLIDPPDAATVDPAVRPFSWNPHTAVKTYLIEFIDEDPDRPVASAFTEKQDYTVPVPVAKYRFVPGRTYFWRVKGFSVDHVVVSESLPRQFQIAKSLGNGVN